ncbi:hypothetical protein DBR06_SOUSAS14510015, partial [Sousa chinensis]
VQDVRITNEALVPSHPVIPNAYTILSSVPPSTQVFIVLDLKGAFLTILLSRGSQGIFALTWMDPDTHHSQHLTRTSLPQRFRDSPHLLGQALASDLSTLSL